jgi:hypothetical protein
VSRDLGELESARGAYAESLDLRRQLRAALGDTPQALLDLGFSLWQIARLERDAGQDASAALAEGRGIADRLLAFQALNTNYRKLRDAFHALQVPSQSSS